MEFHKQLALGILLGFWAAIAMVGSLALAIGLRLLLGKPVIW